MDAAAPAAAQPQVQIKSFDGPLGRRIIDTHIWAVREGLRGATAYDLFDGYCQRLVIHHVPLWRGHTAMETLHPQWSGYGYTWRRDLNAIQPEQYVRGSNIMDEHWQKSPMFDLIRRAQAGEHNPTMRRRLELGPEQRDFEVLDEFFAAGATDYFAQLFIFGERGDPAHGTGIVYSFSTDRRGGFDDRRYRAAAGDAACAVAGNEGARRLRDRLRTAADLPRRGDRPARPCRRDRARLGREHSRGALVRRHPRLHRQRATACRGRRSSIFSTMCSRH